SVAAAFQLPEPLKGHLEIGNDRHAKHATAWCCRISRSSCKLCCANASAEDSAGQSLIGNMDESRHADPLRLNLYRLHPVVATSMSSRRLPMAAPGQTTKIWGTSALASKADIPHFLSTHVS